VGPPGHWVGDGGCDRAADRKEQHQHDDSLAGRVLGAGRQGRRFGVEAAPARAVAPGGHLGLCGGGGDGVRVHGITIVRFAVDVEGLVGFRSRIHIVFDLGGVFLGLDDVGVAHLVGLLDRARAVALPHHAGREGRVGGPGDLLALAHDHGDEDDQPRHDKRDHDE